MFRSRSLQFLLSVVIGDLLGFVLVHHLAPTYEALGGIVGALLGATTFAISILRGWQRCRGDGTCNTCPKPGRLGQFCGNHARIRTMLYWAWLFFGTLLTGLLVLLGYAAGATLVIYAQEFWEHIISPVIRYVRGLLR